MASRRSTSRSNSAKGGFFGFDSTLLHPFGGFAELIDAEWIWFGSWRLRRFRRRQPEGAVEFFSFPALEFDLTSSDCQNHCSAGCRAFFFDLGIVCLVTYQGIPESGL